MLLSAQFAHLDTFSQKVKCHVYNVVTIALNVLQQINVKLVKLDI